MPDNNYSIHINIKAISNFGQITKKLDAQLNKMQRSVNKTTVATKRSSAAFKSMDVAMTRLAFVAIPAFGLAMRSIYKEGTKFETATKDLSALTGIQGDRLVDLTKKADALSVQWGLSADNIVSGMKRIASNKSEFIEIEGAIEDVAEKAAVLARASGLTFYKTGEVITQTMNQFKMGLKDSDRIINAFAAGAKLGSFEIDKLAQVFSRAGGAMKSIGLEFEDAMGVAMIGSRLGLTGEMVGTQLKTGLLRLAQQDDIFNPLIHGFDKSLDALVKAKLTPAELMAIFGLESFQVMQAVTQNQKLFKYWRKELTGTNLAYEQAAINMKAISKHVEILWQKFKKIQRDWFFNPKTQQGIRNVIKGLNEFLDQSTWQALLLKNTFVGLGKAIGVAFAIWGSAKLIKGLLVLKTITKFLMGKTAWAGIGKALKSMKILGAGKILFAGIAKAFLIVTAIANVAKEIWKSFQMTSGLLETMFAADDWTDAGEAIGLAMGYGIRKGLIRTVGFLSLGWIDKWIGETEEGSRLKFGGYGKWTEEGIDSAINRSNNELRIKLNELQMRSLDRTSFLDKHLEANPDIAKRREEGEITVRVIGDKGSGHEVVIQDIKGPVKAEVGDTGVGGFTPTPAYAIPAFANFDK